MPLDQEIERKLLTIKRKKREANLVPNLANSNGTKEEKSLRGYYIPLIDGIHLILGDQLFKLINLKAYNQSNDSNFNIVWRII